MQVLVTGGTGFIGGALLPALRAAGHEIVVLSRGTHADVPGCRYIHSLDEIGAGDTVNAVINLAGASLAARRWSAAYRREIIDSRLDTTRAVVALCARLDTPPAALLSASAIGYYGHQGDEPLDEHGAVASGFSHSLCADWEALASGARDSGVRVCLLRLGVVLDAGGGALAEMARSFRLGVGSWVGTGEQWLSWVHRADVVSAVLFLLAHSDLAGPFNLTAPAAVTARQFCRALERHHRTLFSAGVPAPLMRLALGEMADELLINGQRVEPAALLAAGFEFRYPGIEAALAAIYGD
jgi:uncharacterized protein (TIGR01777 family)